MPHSSCAPAPSGARRPATTLALWCALWLVAALLPARAGGTLSPTVAFLGDSFTYGVGASNPADGWAALVATQMGWNAANFACGGTGYVATYNDQWQHCPNYLGTIEAAAATNPDIVVVSGGLNDLKALGADAPTVIDAVNATYTTLRSRLPNARIIAVGPPNANWAPDAGHLDVLVQDAARSVGAQYISLLTPPPVLNDAMYSAEYPGHPNDAGHAAIATRVLASLQAR